MAEETIQFSKQHQVDDILQDYLRRAFVVNTRFPLNFLAEEIFRTSKSDELNTDLLELRKKVNRFSKLLAHLKTRDEPDKQRDELTEDEEKRFQDYSTKHNLRHHRKELIAFSYMAGSENPLLFIAKYIAQQPDYKIIMKKEIEEQTKKEEIYTKLISKIIQDKPMNLKQIEEFSTNYVHEEFKKMSL